jgi:hypothetical protein
MLSDTTPWGITMSDISDDSRWFEGDTPPSSESLNFFLYVLP